MSLPTTPFRWPTVDGSHVIVHMVKDDIVLGTLDGEKAANAWNATTGMLMVRDDDRDSALDLDKTPKTKNAKHPFTVVFFVDGDYGVEAFVKEVWAKKCNHAFDAAVRAAKKDGGTSSGRSLHEHEWQNATEIGIFEGHGLDAYRIG